MNDAIAGMGGPLLRAWQKDPFNKNSQYFAGYDSTICTTALTNAVGAAWVTKPGPLGKAGYTAIPLYEGVAPTNHVTSTECGDDCAFISKKMMATALVSPQPGPCLARVKGAPSTARCQTHGQAAQPLVSVCVLPRADLSSRGFESCFTAAYMNSSDVYCTS